MIGFGCVTTSEQVFRAGAARAIECSAELDSPLLRRHGGDAVGALCNDMLDRATERDVLEAFVLLAEGVSLEEEGFLTKVRRSLATHADAALIGMADRRRSSTVDLLDGRVVVFSPWALGKLRFDDALAVPFDCAVADLCYEARARGRRIVADDLGLVRPILCQRLGDRGRLVRGSVVVRRKWTAGLEPRRP